jgi:hypothetical protein
MTDPSNASSPVPETLVADTPCRRCGYNLRGLASDGQCPECGTLIKISLRHDLLEHSDPDWLITLRSGAVWILRYIAGMVVIFTAMMICVVQRVRVPTSAMMAVNTVITAIYVSGFYLLTTRDPSGLGEAEYGRTRRLVRTLLVTELAFTAVAIGLNYAGRVVSLPMAVTTVIRPAVGAAVNLIVLAVWVVSLDYLEKLTLRIPDPGLSKRAGSLKTGLAIAGVVVSVGILTIPFMIRGRSPSRRSPVVGFLSCGWAIGAVVLLIYALRYVRLISKLSSELRKLAVVARESWATIEAPPEIKTGD